MAAQPRKIVVGYDGSDAARRALDAAADLVGYGSTLTVVSVPLPGAANGREAVDRAREHLRRRQISALYLEQPGPPAEAIADTARALDAGLIVVARSERPSPGADLGSVSAEVLREAPCDVLVVR